MPKMSTCFLPGEKAGGSKTKGLIIMFLFGEKGRKRFHTFFLCGQKEGMRRKSRPVRFPC